MLDEQLSSAIKEKFRKEMGKGKVSLLLFGEKEECEICGEYAEVMKEISLLHPNLSFSVLNSKSEEARKNSIDLVPSLVIRSEKTGGSATFCGFPMNHLFKVMLDDICEASTGEPPIDKALSKKIKEINSPVKLRIFVSMTCPHCPPALKVAHDFSLINPNISAQMVDTSSFREVANAFRVMSVPKTVINDSHEYVGAQPGEELLKEILAPPKTPGKH